MNLGRLFSSIRFPHGKPKFTLQDLSLFLSLSLSLCILLLLYPHLQSFYFPSLTLLYMYNSKHARKSSRRINTPRHLYFWVFSETHTQLLTIWDDLQVSVNNTLFCQWYCVETKWHIHCKIIPFKQQH